VFHPLAGAGETVKALIINWPANNRLQQTVLDAAAESQR
jgi:hypothetical protein